MLTSCESEESASAGNISFSSLSGVPERSGCHSFVLGIDLSGIEDVELIVDENAPSSDSDETSDEEENV